MISDIGVWSNCWVNQVMGNYMGKTTAIHFCGLAVLSLCSWD